VKRLIIKIDEEKCTGCGLCVPGCAEGALQIIDGKARLVNEIFCDGLGACLGECPEGALTLEEREALPFDEAATEAHVAKMKAGQTPSFGCPSTRERVLQPRHSHPHHGGHQHGGPHHHHGGHDHKEAEGTLPCGCPSSSERVLQRPVAPVAASTATPSQLGQWPVQLTLVSPQAPFFRESDLLVAADCVPFAYADFHQDLLIGRSLVVGCPKLDNAQAYVNKLAEIIARNNLKSITVAHMEVPCCFGMMQIVRAAMQQAGMTVPVKDVTIGVDGTIKTR